MYDIGTELQYHQAKVSFADPFSAKDTLAWLVPYESQSDITSDTIQQNQTSSAWVCFGVRDNGMIVGKNHNLFDIGIWMPVFWLETFFPSLFHRPPVLCDERYGKAGKWEVPIMVASDSLLVRT